MNKYEMLYIIENAITDEEKLALIEKVETVITSNGGEIENVDKWGTKKFAYPINDKNEGYYVLANFTASAEIPALIERQFQILDNAYRCMIIKK